MVVRRTRRPNPERAKSLNAPRFTDTFEGGNEQDFKRQQSLNRESITDASGTTRTREEETQNKADIQKRQLAVGATATRDTPTLEELETQQAQANAPLPQAERIPLEVGEEAFKAGTDAGVLGAAVGDVVAETPFTRAVAATQFLETASVESLMAKGFTERDIKILDEGKGKIDELSQVIEGLPFGLGRKRIKGFGLADFAGESTGKKIDDLKKSIQANSETISTALDQAEAFPFQRRTWLAQAEEAKENILDLESEIKILSIQSTEIQANPEKANSIQTEILNTKLKYPEIFT